MQSAGVCVRVFVHCSGNYAVILEAAVMNSRVSDGSQSVHVFSPD